MADRPAIAIIGGTGDLGSGLAKHWSKAGYPVVIGSRSPERAEALAAEIGGGVAGASYRGAAEKAEIVILAIPFASHEEAIAEIAPAVQGKIVVDAVVPLVPPKVSTVQLPAEGSAAKIAQRLLGEGVRVVSAFHNVGASKLHAGEPVDCDVLIFGDDKEARAAIVPLCEAIGARGLEGGALANSTAAEALTSILISINRKYKSAGAGIRITGLPQAAAE